MNRQEFLEKYQARIASLPEQVTGKDAVAYFFWSVIVGDMMRCGSRTCTAPVRSDYPYKMSSCYLPLCTTCPVALAYSMVQRTRACAEHRHRYALKRYRKEGGDIYRYYRSLWQEIERDLSAVELQEEHYETGTATV